MDDFSGLDKCRFEGCLNFFYEGISLFESDFTGCILGINRVQSFVFYNGLRSACVGELDPLNAKSCALSLAPDLSRSLDFELSISLFSHDS